MKINNEKIKLSVILPVYNVEKYLDDCLNSLLNQSFTDFELIAVNDGSTDNSLSILEGYKEKFNHRLIILEQDNQGLSMARNNGIAISKGEYIYLLDSDDYISKDTFNNCLKQLYDNDADMILFNAKAFIDGMSERDVRKLDYTRNLSKPFYFDGNEVIYESLTSGKYIVQSCCFMYKKSLSLGLNFIPGILHEDNFFTTMLISRSKNIVIDTNRYFQRRIRPGSITTVQKDHRHAHGYLSTLEGLYLYKDEIGKNNQWIKKLSSTYLINAICITYKLDGKLSIYKRIDILKKYFYWLNYKAILYLVAPSVLVGYRNFNRDK